jgi:hypothetical protein
MVAPRFLLASAALAAMVLVTTGCSLLVKTDAEQCDVDADCAARGADFADTVCVEHVCQTKVDPKWGCLGHVEPRMGGSMVTVKIQLLDIISGAPPKNLTVKLCSKFDPPCNGALSPETVAADGTVTVKVASDFQGYLDIQGTDYFPTLVFIDPLFDALNGDIQMITKGSANGLAMQAKVALDPAKGLVAARTVDCQATRSSGVSVSIFPSGSETGYYLIGSGISPSATATDSSGNSGFVNVAPGTPTLTATRGPGGAEIGKVTTLVRAGAITYQIVGPTSTL